jgi:hypothetical protein
VGSLEKAGRRWCCGSFGRRAAGQSWGGRWWRTTAAGRASTASEACSVLESTIGSFADQPSALLPINRRRRTPARRSRSNRIGELVCVANDRAAFSVFLPCYLKGKYKRWPSIRPPCAECPRDAPRLCTTCTNMHGDEALLLLKTRPATECVLVIHQNRKR